VVGHVTQVDDLTIEVQISPGRRVWLTKSLIVGTEVLS